MTARDTSLVQPHEQIVGFINPSGSHEGDWVARTKYVRPEKQETLGDFCAALFVWSLIVIAVLEVLAIASASQAVPHV